MEYYFAPRSRARFAGYFDLICTGLAAFYVVEKLWCSLDFSVFQDLTVLIVLIIGLQTAVIILLLRARKYNTDPKKSLKRVIVWLWINYILLVFVAIGGLFFGLRLQLFMIVCVRGILIMMVRIHKDELDEHCAKKPYQIQSPSQDKESKKSLAGLV